MQDNRLKNRVKHTHCKCEKCKRKKDIVKFMVKLWEEWNKFDKSLKVKP